MTTGGVPTVLFRAAAGPRVGYGHLMRCGALASAMDVRAFVCFDRPRREVTLVARRLGLHVCTGRHLLRRVAPSLVVVDDPDPIAAARWARRARAGRIPVASIHDRGIGRIASDLVIDGALGARSRRRRDLVGPRFAILREDILATRRAAPRRSRRVVVIALGGGSHVRRHGADLATKIRACVPGARVLLAPGFGLRVPPPLPPGCVWLQASDRLAHALATAAAGVVAGGLTMYEAAALGTPMVGVAVVPAQRLTVRRFARAGATWVAGDVSSPRGRRRAADMVARLLQQPSRARRLGRRAGRLVDARGGARVIRQLTRLVARAPVKGGRRVA